MNLLARIEPEGINRIDEEGWEEIEFAVDSGASENVMGEDMLRSVEVKEGEAARRGVEYEVANGVRIPNLGEKTFVGFTDTGVRRNLKVQVCDVNKGLLSVSRVVQHEHRAVFDSDGSYLEDKATGEKLWLQEKGGMYVLKLWVKKDF